MRGLRARHQAAAGGGDGRGELPAAPRAAARDPIPRSFRRLSTLDRYLPLWIFAAMAARLSVVPHLPAALGRPLPCAGRRRLSCRSPSASLLDDVPGAGQGAVREHRPARRRHEARRHVTRAQLGGRPTLSCWRSPGSFLPDLPHYRNGLVHHRPFHAASPMVLIWNFARPQLPASSAAVLVALNSVFQILHSTRCFGWLLPDGGAAAGSAPTIHARSTSRCAQISKSVLIFLGVPLVAGILDPEVPGSARNGVAWYDGVIPTLRLIISAIWSATDPWPNEVVNLIKAAGISGVAGNYYSTVATGYKHCGCRQREPGAGSACHTSASNGRARRLPS